MDTKEARQRVTATGPVTDLRKQADVDDSTERWLAVPGYEGLYETSDLGHVRSLDRPERINRGGGTFTRLRRGRVLRPRTGSRKYYKVHLGRDGITTEYNVHTLVLLTFVGPRPDDMECRHLNDIKTDNRLVNLTWGTKSENKQDELRNGHNRNLSKTHCKHGHEFTPENTCWRAADGRRAGRRACRQCINEQARARSQRRRAAAMVPMSQL